MSTLGHGSLLLKKDHRNASLIEAQKVLNKKKQKNLLFVITELTFRLERILCNR